MAVALQYKKLGGSSVRLTQTFLSGESFFDTDVGAWFIGDGATAGGRQVANALVVAISAATYNVTAADGGKFFVFTNAAGCGVAINHATSTYFPEQTGIWLLNGSPANVVITATTSTINGLSTLTLNPGDSAVIVSDGSNYFALVVRNGISVATAKNIHIVGNVAPGNTSSSTVPISGITLSATGGVSLGLSGSTLIYSNPNVNATENVTALGNTTALTSSTTYVLGSSLLSGAGDLSLGFSGSTLILSAPSAATSASSRGMVALGNTTGATSTTTMTLTQLTFSGAAGASVGFDTTGPGAGVVILSQAPIAGGATNLNLTATGNTTGATSSMVATLTGQTVSFGGVLSGGFSAGTLVVSGAIAGVNALSYFEPRPLNSTNAGGTSILGNGTMIMIPLNLPAQLSFNRVRFMISYNLATLFGPGVTVVTTTTSDTLTCSMALTETVQVGHYTRANVTQFSSSASNLTTTGLNASASVSRSSDSATVSQTISYIYNADTTTGSTSTSLTSSHVGNTSYGPLNAFSTFFTGFFDFIVPMSTTMGSGLNIVGVRVSSATAQASMSTGASYVGIPTNPVNLLFVYNGAIGNSNFRTTPGGAQINLAMRPFGGGVISTAAGAFLASYNPNSMSNGGLVYNGGLWCDLFLGS